MRIQYTTLTYQVNVRISQSFRANMTASFSSLLPEGKCQLFLKLWHLREKNALPDMNLMLEIQRKEVNTNSKAAQCNRRIFSV